MLTLLFATACAGIFCGAAVYVNLVEHPARVSCGQEIALREFAPSYRRGALMQASLAVVGCVLGLATAWQLGDRLVALAAILLGSVVPFTLLFILPVNRQLLDPGLDSSSGRVGELLARWNALHAVRTVLSACAFVLMLFRVAAYGIR